MHIAFMPYSLISYKHSKSDPSPIPTNKALLRSLPHRLHKPISKPNNTLHPHPSIPQPLPFPLPIIIIVRQQNLSLLIVPCRTLLRDCRLFLTTINEFLPW